MDLVKVLLTDKFLCVYICECVYVCVYRFWAADLLWQYVLQVNIYSTYKILSRGGVKMAEE